jgi:small-conductance mechanosensitive channel
MPENAMKRLIAILIAIAALSEPLYAQSRAPPKSDDPAEQLKIDEARRVEQQYKDTLKRMDSKKTEASANDPWANMRGTDNSKTDSKNQK